MIDNSTLLYYYWIGWHDEKDTLSRIYPNSKILKRAYELGRSHYILGDEVTSVDAWPDNHRLKLIKNET